MKFILFTIISILIALGFVWLGLSYYFKTLMLEVLNIPLPPDHTYFKILVYQEQKMRMIFVVIAASMSVFAFIFGVLFSHRVAGPIVKLKNHLNQLADGKDPGELNFRKNDFFGDLDDSYNRAFNKIKK